jgi:hypothetical protein
VNALVASCSLMPPTSRRPPRFNSILTTARALGRGLGRLLEVHHYYEKIVFVDVIGPTSLRFQCQYE